MITKRRTSSVTRSRAAPLARASPATVERLLAVRKELVSADPGHRSPHASSPPPGALPAR